MLMTIVPDLGAESTPGPNVAPLAFALDRMTPELWLPAPGEGVAEREARRLAASDILAELLAEYAEAVAS